MTPIGLLFLTVAAFMFVMAAEEGWPQEAVWVDVRALTVEGQAWTDTASPFDRLPAKAKGLVPDPVWGLGTNSAGIAVRFITDATAIGVRWKLRSGTLAMNHMPATGMSGVDLYVRMPPDQQKPPGQIWHWVAIGRPEAQENEKTLVSGIPKGEHEFLLYFPLYNGTLSCELSVPDGATLSPAPPRGKPVVFYGTSITQGGCASRPGMAYPAIIGRMLDVPTVNLGFSGNGKMDLSVVALLAEIDAAAYVIDCCPNLTPELISERTGPLVHTLRQARPNTPIVLVENVEYQASAFLPGLRNSYQSKNAAFRAEYEKLVTEGVKGLFYVAGERLFGDDGEATVDGTHATDLGFLRQAQALAPILREALGL
ncbi:MAG: SGNH/GDSL hydrolase family protein [Candidatus Zipacnadales bacterium]